jgi:uncharacterized protein YbaR (Trm112 family)
LPEPLKRVTCPDCQQPTLVRVSTLIKISGYQPESSIGSGEVPLACPYCKHLGLGFVDEDSRLSGTADQVKSFDDITEFSITLKCAQKGCTFPIEVLAPMILCKDENQARDRVPGLGWAKYPLCELAYSLQRPLLVLDVHKFS